MLPVLFARRVVYPRQRESRSLLRTSNKREAYSSLFARRNPNKIFLTKER